MCDLQFMAAAIVRKGDPDSGAVCLKLNRFDKGCAVFVPVTSIDGERAWMHGLKSGFDTERNADAFLQKQMERDADLWVVEIEDPKGQYELDAKLLS